MLPMVWCALLYAVAVESSVEKRTGIRKLQGMEGFIYLSPGD